MILYCNIEDFLAQKKLPLITLWQIVKMIAFHCQYLHEFFKIFPETWKISFFFSWKNKTIFNTY